MKIKEIREGILGSIASGIGNAVAPNAMNDLKKQRERSAYSAANNPHQHDDSRKLQLKAHEIYKNWIATLQSTGTPIPVNPTDIKTELDQFLQLPTNLPPQFELGQPPKMFAGGQTNEQGTIIKLELTSPNPTDIEFYIASTLMYNEQLLARHQTQQRVGNQAAQPSGMDVDRLAGAGARLDDGVSMVSIDPLRIKYGKAQYALNDNGEWATWPRKAPVQQALQVFLDRQADIIEKQHGTQASAAQTARTALIGSMSPQQKQQLIQQIEAKLGITA